MMETYGSIMRKKLDAGEITWQQAFNWLQLYGVTARFASKLLKGHCHD